MDAPVQWIENAETLTDVLDGTSGTPLALDAEADSLHHYPEKVCLIQLSADGSDYILDPLVGFPLDALGRALSDRSRTKILHGADYDLRSLNRDFGFRMSGLFDTMIAARLTGDRAFGLASLLERNFAVKLDKRFQRADWSRRPLTDEMIEYASLDTRYLQELADRLRGRLLELGRLEWAAEEFERLESVRWRDGEDDEAYRRLKGAGRLDRTGLAVLRELHRLREQEACRLDRPPFRVMRNEVLLELARVRPSEREALREISGMPRPWSRGSSADELLARVRVGVEMADEDKPVRRRGRRRESSPELERELKRLAGLRDRVAAELDLEPPLLAPRGLLERLAEGGAEAWTPDRVPELRRWQWEQLKPLRDA